MRRRPWLDVTLPSDRVVAFSIAVDPGKDVAPWKDDGTSKVIKANDYTVEFDSRRLGPGRFRFTGIEHPKATVKTIKERARISGGRVKVRP